MEQARDQQGDGEPVSAAVSLGFARVYRLRIRILKASVSSYFVENTSGMAPMQLDVDPLGCLNAKCP